MIAFIIQTEVTKTTISALARVQYLSPFERHRLYKESKGSLPQFEEPAKSKAAVVPTTEDARIARVREHFLSLTEPQAPTHSQLLPKPDQDRVARLFAHVRSAVTPQSDAAAVTATSLEPASVVLQTITFDEEGNRIQKTGHDDENGNSGSSSSSTNSSNSSSSEFSDSSDSSDSDSEEVNNIECKNKSEDDNKNSKKKTSDSEKVENVVCENKSEVDNKKTKKSTVYQSANKRKSAEALPLDDYSTNNKNKKLKTVINASTNINIIKKPGNKKRRRLSLLKNKSYCEKDNAASKNNASGSQGPSKIEEASLFSNEPSNKAVKRKSMEDGVEPFDYNSANFKMFRNNRNNKRGKGFRGKVGLLFSNKILNFALISSTL